MATIFIGQKTFLSYKKNSQIDVQDFIKLMRDSKMNMLKTLATLSLFGMTSLANAQAPHPSEVEIKNIRVNGSGCPAGTATALVTNSNPGGPADYFQVTYDEFIVEKGPDAYESFRKFCNIAVDIKYPQGWSFSLFNMEMDGYVDIGKGAVGELKTSYRFPFVTGTKTFRKKFKGPFEGDYSEGQDLGIFTAIRSKCGRTIPLNIKTTLWIKGSRKNNSMMTVDIQSGVITQLFGLKWKRCKK